MTDIWEINWAAVAQAGWIILVGLMIWATAQFIISRIVNRITNGYALFKKSHFRWAAPVLRTLDHARRVQRAETIGSLLRSVVTVVIVTVVVISALQALGMPVATLLTSVGILGVAVGFGAQQLIRDFLSGIFITLEDQFGIGDVIECGEVVGVVESLGLRITRVRGDDGAVWYLRNGEILRVGNRSQGNYVAPEDEAVSPESGGTVTGSDAKVEHKAEQKAGE